MNQIQASDAAEEDRRAREREEAAAREATRRHRALSEEADASSKRHLELELEAYEGHRKYRLKVLRTTAKVIAKMRGDERMAPLQRWIAGYNVDRARLVRMREEERRMTMMRELGQIPKGAEEV